MQNFGTYDNPFWEKSNPGREKEREQERFLQCQTPTSTVRVKVKGFRMKNGGCRIKSEE